MTDLTTLLRDLSVKAGKATADPDITPVYPPLCSPALIQALVEVVLAAIEDGHMYPIPWRIQEALRRLEAVTQQL